MALGPGDPLYESWKAREAQKEAAKYAARKAEELFLKGAGRAGQAASKALPKSPASAAYVARVWQACVKVAGQGVGAAATIMRTMASSAYSVGGRLVVGALESATAAGSAVAGFCQAVLADLGAMAAGVSLAQIAGVILIVAAIIALGYWIMNSEKQANQAGKIQDARNKAEHSLNNQMPYVMPRFEPGRLG